MGLFKEANTTPKRTAVQRLRDKAHGHACGSYRQAPLYIDKIGFYMTRGDGPSHVDKYIRPTSLADMKALEPEPGCSQGCSFCYTAHPHYTTDEGHSETKICFKKLGHSDLLNFNRPQ